MPSGSRRLIRQIARIDLVDFDHAIVSRLVGIARLPGSRAGSRRLASPVGIRRPEVVYWNTPDVGDKQRTVVRESAMPNG